MKKIFTILSSLLLLAGGAAAQSPAVKGYDAFHLVQTRNIFDPTRRGTPRAEVAQQRTERNGSRNRANTFTLTGTMVTDGKTLAFFSGTRSEYSKVIPVGESVAEYKVTGITATQVELQRDGKTTVLGVGKMFQLEGSTVVEASSATPEDAPEAAPADATAPTTTTAPAPTNDKTEILRRLMERRAKEMTK